MPVIDQRLGAQVDQPHPTKDGRATVTHYEHGATYLIGDETWEIHGLIWEKYKALGAEDSFLGLPTSNENPCPDKDGAFSHFEHGGIYWTPHMVGGPHEIHGAIWTGWAASGYERGPLGYPTTDELPTADNSGRFNHFDRGAIYWKQGSKDAYEVHGDIGALYKSIGYEQTFLGYPTNDETPCPDGVGRFNHFEHGGVYWTPELGAHEVHGAIWDHWGGLGWERSKLGYPTSNEYRVRGTDKKRRISGFQHGHISWTAAEGAQDHAEPAPALPQLHVIPIYWGSTWQVNGGIKGVTSIDMHAAAEKIVNGHFLAGIDQYGLGPGLISAPIIHDGDPPNPHSNDQIDADLDDLIKAQKVPDPNSFAADEIPLYCYMLHEGYIFVEGPNGQGKRLDDNGYHWMRNVKGRDIGMAWVSQANDLPNTTIPFAHEVVESFTEQEIADHEPDDPPGWFSDRLDGVTVPAYWSDFNNTWVIPTLANSRDRNSPIP